MVASPLPSRSPQGGEESTWLHNPCLLGVPTVGRKQHGYIIATFSGSPWWGEINMTTQTLPSGVPMVGRNQYGYITHAIDMDYGGQKLASHSATRANAPSEVPLFWEATKEAR